MSVTAFPVLARILKDSGLVATKVGAVVLEAAAINDAIAWLLLILAVSVSSSAGQTVALWMLLCVLGYAVFIMVVFKWFLQHAVRIYESLYLDLQADNNLYSLIFILTLCSGWFVSQLGLDPIIGSFMFGIIVPRNTRLHASCLHKMHAFFLTMFLPIYFAYSGLRTDFTTIRLFPDLPILLLLIVLSSVGKFLGAGLPAYYFGFTLRESAVIAVLMNTRGLVEFIVLNVGLDAGIVSARTYSVLIVMCLVDTFATYPLVQWLFPEHLREAEAIAHQEAVDSSAERSQQALLLQGEDDLEMVAPQEVL
jgi:Kef-type K+ transport system membrane component KefB